MVTRLGPDDPRYNEARTLHNAMIDRRPAVILQCGEAQEVASALAEAQRVGMEFVDSSRRSLGRGDVHKRRRHGDRRPPDEDDRG